MSKVSKVSKDSKVSKNSIETIDQLLDLEIKSNSIYYFSIGGNLYHDNDHRNKFAKYQIFPVFLRLAAKRHKDIEINLIVIDPNIQEELIVQELGFTQSAKVFFKDFAIYTHLKYNVKLWLIPTHLPYIYNEKYTIYKDQGYVSTSDEPLVKELYAKFNLVINKIKTAGSIFIMANFISIYNDTDYAPFKYAQFLPEYFPNLINAFNDTDITSGILLDFKGYCKNSSDRQYSSSLIDYSDQPGSKHRYDKGYDHNIYNELGHGIFNYYKLSRVTKNLILQLEVTKLLNGLVLRRTYQPHEYDHLFKIKF